MKCWTFVVGFLISIQSVGASEIRESYDASGRLVQIQEVDRNIILAETKLDYDRKGHLIQRSTQKQGKSHLETFLYLPSGKLAEHVIWEENTRVSRKTYLYQKGRLSSITEEEPGLSLKTTTYIYDRYGSTVLVEAQSSDGTPISRIVSERERPLTPISLTFSGGFELDTSAFTQEIEGGFRVDRKPTVEYLGGDPLELHAAASVKRQFQESDPTLSELTSNFGIDYNLILPRTTLFLFMDLERQPISGLDLDLIFAPLGIKFDIIPRGKYLLDASFAPVWNFRVISPTSEVASTGDCAGTTMTTRSDVLLCETQSQLSRVQGSFRARAAYRVDAAKVMDVVEIVPALGSSSTESSAIQETLIFRNTFRIEWKITESFSLQYEIKFVKDPSLESLCPSDPDEWLCQGRSLESVGSAALHFDLKR